jgi:hypothetical protein
MDPRGGHRADPSVSVCVDTLRRPLYAYGTAFNNFHNAVLSEDQLGSTPKGSASAHIVCHALP